MLHKEEEKATRLSTACFQLLILFQVGWFIGVAKVRHLVLSLSRKVIELLLFLKRFERAFKTRFARVLRFVWVYHTRLTNFVGFLAFSLHSIK